MKINLKHTLLVTLNLAFGALGIAASASGGPPGQPPAQTPQFPDTLSGSITSAAGWCYILLPKGATALGASRNGVVLLKLGEHDYYRWNCGKISSLTPPKYSTEFRDWPNANQKFYKVWAATIVESTGTIGFSYRYEDSYILPRIVYIYISVWRSTDQYPIVMDGDPPYLVNPSYLSRSATVLGIDSSDYVYGTFSSPDAGGAHQLYKVPVSLPDYSKAYKWKVGIHARFGGLNQAGTIIAIDISPGGLYPSVGIVGDTTVNFAPIYINDNNYVLGVASLAYSYYLNQYPAEFMYKDGIGRIPLPSDGRVTWIDKKNRPNGLDPSGNPVVWINKLDSTGVPVSPAHYDRQPYVPLPAPTNWTTTHMIPRDTTDAQLGVIEKNGEKVPFLAFRAELAVDSDRSGQIKFIGDAGYDADVASTPFEFWLNDDDDRSDKDHIESSKKDWEDSEINSVRDLEDFSRLNIYIGGLQDAVLNGSLKIGLKWKNIQSGTPSVKVWRNLSPNGGREYLFDENIANQHLTLGAPGHVQGTATYLIPLSFWQQNGFSATQPNGFFLFEGCNVGKGQLVLTINKSDGTEIGEGPGVWLDIKNIKSMYERGKGTPEDGINAPFESYYSQPNPAPTTYVRDPNGHPFQQPQDEEDSLVVLVHGIHGPFTAAPEAYEENIVSAETVFKRLWHQGFKGRFAFYKWPALNPAGVGSTGFNFNESEYRAWKYGRGLALFVNSINKASKSLYAHSQGNIVCGAALTDYGLTVDNYVLTQAAVPAGCYDVSGGQSDPNSINGFQRFWIKEANKPTPDFKSDLGYRGYLQNLNVTGNVRNFYNEVDYALATGTILLGLIETNWVANQESYKPDGAFRNGNRYAYIPGDPAGQRIHLVDDNVLGRFVTDPHEAMSMVARPRSKAVGAKTGVGGSIDAGLNLETFTNAEGDSVFTRSSDDHGAQVTRSIQEVWPYYTELGRTLGIIPLP